MAAVDHPEQRRETLRSLRKLPAAVPGVMESFNELHRHSLADGALSKAAKELIALGIAIGVRCDHCIDLHVHDALRAGATPQQIEEATGVAILMGGGPSVMYGAQALDALAQFQADQV